MYSICTIYDLNARHALKKGADLIEKPHTHTFKLEVELSSKQLDDTGCVVDFLDLDSRVADILGAYKNTDLHQHHRFAGKSPSAEVLAEVLFTDIQTYIVDIPVRLERVTVWEDERHAGSYRGEL